MAPIQQKHTVKFNTLRTDSSLAPVACCAHEESDPLCVDEALLPVITKPRTRGNLITTRASNLQTAEQICQTFRGKPVTSSFPPQNVLELYETKTITKCFTETLNVSEFCKCVMTEFAGCFSYTSLSDFFASDV